MKIKEKAQEYAETLLRYLEPYTEPEYRNLSQEIANCDKPETNNLKDNMEEKELGKEDNSPTKELNLCDFLKDCIGEEFWSPMFDVVKLSRINIDNNKPLSFKWKDGVIYTLTNGVMYSNTLPIIFPSRAFYEKYPLDPYSAWMEWKEARKPRFKFEVYLSGYDNGVMMADIAVKEQFQFKTYEEIMQAAEAVRECLEKFHKDHTQS